ncbi:MAG: VOC family protein [Pseudomonadota bacterium]
MPRLDYLELSTRDLAKTKAFFEKALDMKFTDYGPDYASTTTGDTDIGLHHSPELRPRTMGVICVDDLEKYLEKVKAAGGEIVLETISFPGGRRFEFVDPGGNRIGIWEKGE